MTHTQYFYKGHPLHPGGAVIVTTFDESGATVSVDTYTLDEWAALQSGQ